MDRHHTPLSGSVQVGGWSLDFFLEQKHPVAPAAEDIFIDVVAGRLRIAVVDPAINENNPSAHEDAALAWGVTRAHLRSVPTPGAALCEANDRVRSLLPGRGWMRGAMLCVAVIDVDPHSPAVLEAARVGDTEFHAGVEAVGPIFSGSCWSTETVRELRERRRGLVNGGDPLRWRIQEDFLSDKAYVSTPIGLVDDVRFQAWGTMPANRILVTTDGAVDDDGSVVEDLRADCFRETGPLVALPHGDRAVVRARFSG